MNTLLQRSRYLNVWLGCLPVILALAAYTISAEHFENVRTTLAADNFLGDLNQVLSTVKDAETGQRGYLLTGQARYIAPYENALKVIDKQMAQLDKEAPRNEIPPGQIRQLHALVTEKLAELKGTIALRQIKGPAEALREVETGKGQIFMDQIRDRVDQITRRQRATLAARLDHQRRNQLLLEWVLVIGVASGLLTLFLSVRVSALYKTERDRAEAEIRHAKENLELRVKRRTAELERSNEDLLQFAYVASHDLQEPLRTVGSYVGLLARKYGHQLDQTAQTYMQFAVEGAERMQTLINDLLLYSRAGTQAVNARTVSAEQIVDAAVRNLEVSIRESGAVIRYGNLPTILADETKLTQVFQNLLANGMKFHKPDTVPQVTISAKRESDNWVFSVADNGIGFEEKYADRIFQVFQRLHGVGKYPGNGIGLAISKRIIEHHGGRLWAESKLGEGSCFCFSLPGGEPEDGHSNRRTTPKKDEIRKSIRNV